MDKVFCPAGFWRRSAALSVDMLLLLPFYMLAMRYVTVWPAIQLVVTLVPMVAYVFFLSSSWRASPGMRLMRVEAVGADGQPLSKLRAAAWVLASIFFFLIAFAPLLYVQWWMHAYDLLPLAAGMQAGMLSPEEFAMEVQARSGLSLMALNGLVVMCSAVSLVLCLIWALSIVISRKKVGFHNWLSATRFIVRQ